MSPACQPRIKLVWTIPSNNCPHSEGSVSALIPSVNQKWLHWRVHNCWILIHCGLLLIISKQLQIPSRGWALKGTLITLPKTTDFGCIAEFRWNPALLASFYNENFQRVEILQVFFFFFFCSISVHTHISKVGWHQQGPTCYWFDRVVLVLPALACLPFASGFEAMTVSLAVSASAT